jgi:hypothetical protein
MRCPPFFDPADSHQLRKRRSFLRNGCVALGNVGDADRSSLNLIFLALCCVWRVLIEQRLSRQDTFPRQNPFRAGISSKEMQRCFGKPMSYMAAERVFLVWIRKRDDDSDR